MQVHEKSVVVDAPVHDVFCMWSHWDAFPKYMSHVTAVKEIGPNLYHWEGKVAGIEEEWDARATAYVQDKVIGWESVSGLPNKGEVRFDDLGPRTKVTVHFEYDPPAGFAGDIAEWAYVGGQFDKSLEQDLDNFRAQAEIEQGD